jgi:hypothetical protein
LTDKRKVTASSGPIPLAGKRIVRKNPVVEEPREPRNWHIKSKVSRVSRLWLHRVMPGAPIFYVMFAVAMLVMWAIVK